MPIPNPLPMPVLTGPDIVLRPLVASDAEAMFASLSDEEATRLTGTQSRFTRAEVAAHCARVADDPDRVDYVITNGGGAVGEVVLNGLDRPNRTMSFRIAIWTPAARDRGFGSQATAMILRHAFGALHLNRVELEVYAFNPRALHVYETLGFRVEGRRRQALIWDGTPVDAICMGLLAEEYGRPDPLRSADRTSC